MQENFTFRRKTAHGARRAEISRRKGAAAHPASRRHSRRVRSSSRRTRGLRRVKYQAAPRKKETAVYSRTGPVSRKMAQRKRAAQTKAQKVRSAAARSHRRGRARGSRRSRS